MNQPRDPYSFQVPDQPQDQFKSLTLILYVLYIVAIFSAGILAVIALIINYVKLDAVQGSLYASHFKWQIRTFWWYLIWNVIAWIPFIFLFFTTDHPSAFVGVALGGMVFCIGLMTVSWIWIVYRAIRGMLALSENKPMYSMQ
ncbi:putative membrane protein [Acinetobacter calcoaceticus]|uniref:Putative membrane protein n=1 Tax=Acinetobacter calcoaceticus TaxID=471 RepID=A0A4R1Y1K8_ACICA|nr:putative membrane protein [Acinetobacter calcoaceticus]